MQTFTRLLKYFRNYRINIALNVLCNICMVFFNIVSIPMLIPFLQILLGQQIPPTQKPDFQWNIKILTETFYYQLGRIIEVNGKEQALIYVCVGMVIIFFFKNLFRYLALFFITPTLNGIVRDIRREIFDKTLRLPLSYFSDERKGDLMSRVTADVQEVLWGILNAVEVLVREPLLIIGALSIMLYISPVLTGFVFILLLLTGFIIGTIGKSLKKESSELQAQLGSMVSVLDEALGSSRVIKAFNGEQYQREKFAKENNNFLKLLIAVDLRRYLASPMTEFLGIAVVCTLIWFGFKRVEIGELTPASFLAFLYAFFTVIEPSKSFSSSTYNVRKGAGALDRIEEILNAEETIQDAETTTPLSHFKEKIEYKNVSFFYKKDEKQILKNINLTIPKGKIVALVGASGAGKSTIADLLPRFYDVNEGSIFIDDVNIKELKVKDLRGLMGIVTQEAVLFNDTIYNNIVFGKTDVTIADVEAAAKAANAHEFIQNTEGGYQTNIGDRGMKLSGGQRQRLTIARALLRNPDILILDEATSALDSESEKLVQQALTKLMKGRTALVIAHRLSTVQHADEIIVMNGGEIIERGTHDALFKQGGAYRKLVELQGLH